MRLKEDVSPDARKLSIISTGDRRHFFTTVHMPTCPSRGLRASRPQAFSAQSTLPELSLYSRTVGHSSHFYSKARDERKSRVEGSYWGSTFECTVCHDREGGRLRELVTLNAQSGNRSIPGLLSIGWCLLPSGCVFPPQLPQSRNSLLDVGQGLSPQGFREGC